MSPAGCLATVDPPYASSFSSSVRTARPGAINMLLSSPLAQPSTTAIHQRHSLLIPPARTAHRPPPRLWDGFEGNVTLLVDSLGSMTMEAALLYPLAMVVVALGVGIVLNWHQLDRRPKWWSTALLVGSAAGVVEVWLRMLGD